MTDTEILAADPEPAAMVISGAWQLSEFVDQDHVTYTARKDYWGGAPKIDTYTKIYYATEDAQTLALILGDIDTTLQLNQPTAVPTLLQYPDIIKVYQYQSNTTYTWYLNHRYEPFNLKAFRKAVSIGIDRQSQVNFAADGWAVMPNDAEVCPYLSYANPNIEWAYANLSQTERLAQANAALDAIPLMTTIAGGDGTYRKYNGNLMEFEVWGSDSAQHASIMELLVRDLKNMGVKLNIKATTATVLVNAVYRQKSEATALGWETHVWGRPFSPDYDYIADQYDYTPNQWSTRAVIINWQNAAIQDKLTALQTMRPDNPTRIADIQSTQVSLAEEMPVIPLFHSVTPNAYRTDRFKGWVADSGAQQYGAMGAMGLRYNLLSLEPI
jgi:peptide/nickel transport system substrate-binding protein